MKRSDQQRKSWFFWLNMIAVEAAEEGVSFSDAADAINAKGLQYPLTAHFLHEVVAKGLIMPKINPKAKSTGDLDTREFALLEEVMGRALGEFGLEKVPNFPSIEDVLEQERNKK